MNVRKLTMAQREELKREKFAICPTCKRRFKKIVWWQEYDNPACNQKAAQYRFRSRWVLVPRSQINKGVK